MKKVLYTFNWNEGGFNSVQAENKAEAVKLGNQICDVAIPGGCQKLTVDPDSVVRRATKKSQDEYWNNIPLMD